MTPQYDIYDTLILDSEQSAFKNACDLIVKSATKLDKDAGIRIYSDYVITVKASRDRRDYSVFRNRNGKLLLSVAMGKVNSISWEYIFASKHVDKTAKEIGQA